MNRESIFETLKFVVRIGLLVFGPQLVAVATDNAGAVWADALSVLLPVVDKWVHESELKAKGILPF